MNNPILEVSQGYRREISSVKSEEAFGGRYGAK